MTSTETNSKQHIVRKSFLNYLKNEFPFEQDWVHPVSKVLWRNAEVRDALIRLKTLCPENYRVLWALWTTRETAEFLAKRFNYSTFIIKSKWERAINLIMVMLYYPELYENLLLYVD